MKPMTVTRRKIHDCLGMTLDFTEPGKVVFQMDDYIEGLLDEVPSDMTGTASTPAANFLFTSNESAEKLSSQMSQMYHYITANFLYLCKQVRPVLQTAMIFLTTRVTQPDEDDWKTLVRCVRNLRGSKEISLILKIAHDGVIRWYIDESFGIHQDLRSHTGVTMSLEKGSIYSISTKQKIKSKT